jgi:predicted nucleic acid-binding protein
MSDAKALQFVDTNVLVYAHDRSAGVKHQRARALVERLWQTGEGCLSIQVLQELYVSVTRKVPSPFPPAAAAQIITDLGAWRVHSPGVADVLDAIGLQQQHQLAFWDAMILTSAIQSGYQTLWSEDLQSGQQYGLVTVMNPLASDV